MQPQIKCYLISLNRVWYLRVLLSLVLSHCCVGSSRYEHVLYITPNVTCPKSPCYELKTYVQNESRYLQSNTQIIFLPGIHLFDLGQVFVVKDKYAISLIGSDNLTQHSLAEKVHQYGFDHYDEDDNITYLESSTKIMCTNSSALEFSNITELSIINITVMNCGQFSPTTLLKSGVLLLNISGLSMDGVSIQNSTGYGLLGINVLGQTQIVRSSFIANNQYVKNILDKVNAFDLQCNKKTYKMNTIYVNNNSSIPYQCYTLGGGNALLVYNKYSPKSQRNQLTLSYLLFALGIDGQFTPTVITTCGTYTSSPCCKYQGTGLSIFMNQITVVNTDVSYTIFYRNQASYGANFNFVYTVNLNSILKMTNVQTKRGIALKRGAGIMAYYNAGFNSFILSNSTFECNYVPQDNSHKGSSLDITYQDSMSKLDTLESSFTFLADSCLFVSDNGFSSLSIMFSQYTEVLPLLNVTVLINNSRFYDMQQCYYSIYVESYLTFNPLVSLCTSDVQGDVLLWTADANIFDCNFVGSKLSSLRNKVTFNGTVTFNDSLSSGNGGALYLLSATAVIAAGSHVVFSNNTASYGGAAFLDPFSSFMFVSPCNVSFLNNKALFTGGALYVQTVQYAKTILPTCFFNVDDTARIPFKDSFGVHVYFDGNDAAVEGSILYGGDIDNCTTSISTLPYPHNLNTASGLLFDTITKYGKYNSTTSPISSDPTSVCTCLSTCSSSTFANITVYPGQSVNLSFVTIGQRNSTAPSIVVLHTISPKAEIIAVLYTERYCSKYSIPFNPLANQTLLATTERSFTELVTTFYSISMSITVLPCPTGFMLSGSSRCECEPFLHSLGLTCDIERLTVSANSGDVWMGYTSWGVLAFQSQCPFDYCTGIATIKVSDLDSQCNYNRSKVLCGQCKVGLSMMLGSSGCGKCSNYYLLLLIPFAIMGVALVALLFILNLTITTGPLNGLVFYANIIRINEAIFFPSYKIYSNIGTQILSAFIAWLNLDLGIETCFYHLMDSYAKTWLQFAFPAYIFSLVGLIIVAGRLSSTISRLCKFNAVSVLATLVFLSYSKILRTVITIFAFVALHIDPNGQNTNHFVWLYDGNVDYLDFRHGVLFICGLAISIVFIIPYMLMLVFLPCLQAKSHWKCFVWINKLKPFFDCSTALYKDQYRFWPGVLVAVRLPLYLLFAVVDNPTAKLVGILAATYLYSIALCMLSVYKKWVFLVIEVFFHINLTLVALGCLFSTYDISGQSVAKVTSIGIGFVFLIFLGIIIYHMYLRLAKNGMKIGALNEYNPPVQSPEPMSIPVAPVWNNGDFREPLLSD